MNVVNFTGSRQFMLSALPVSLLFATIENRHLWELAFHSYDMENGVVVLRSDMVNRKSYLETYQNWLAGDIFLS